MSVEVLRGLFSSAAITRLLPEIMFRIILYFFAGVEFAWTIEIF